MIDDDVTEMYRAMHARHARARRRMAIAWVALGLLFLAGIARGLGLL